MARALIGVVAMAVLGCGYRPLPFDHADGGAPPGAAGAPSVGVPLGLSAAFSIALRMDGAWEGVLVSALFWTGEERPQPGGRGGPSLRLDEQTGEAVTVNGLPIVGTQADWGYLYQANGIPEPEDGQWLFRVRFRGRTMDVPFRAQRSRFVDFPAGPVSIGDGVTLVWTPPLPENAERQAYLTSCALRDVGKEIGLASAKFRGELAGSACTSRVQIIASIEEPLGAPFAGGAATASIWLDRALELVP